MKTPSLAYQLNRTISQSYERYHSLHISILRQPRFASAGRPPSEQLFAYTWQAHERGCENSPSDWYAQRIDPAGCEKVDDLRACYNFAKRVEAKLEDRHAYTPQNFIAALGKLGLERYTYDIRNSRHVPFHKLLPPEYHCWLMDYRKCGYDCNHGDLVMSTNEDDAKIQLLEYFMRGEGQAESRLSVLKKWDDAGRPVMVNPSFSAQALERRSTIEMLQSPKAKSEAAAVAA